MSLSLKDEEIDHYFKLQVQDFGSDDRRKADREERKNPGERDLPDTDSGPDSDSTRIPQSDIHALSNVDDIVHTAPPALIVPLTGARARPYDSFE